MTLKVFTEAGFHFNMKKKRMRGLKYKRKYNRRNSLNPVPK